MEGGAKEGPVEKGLSSVWFGGVVGGYLVRLHCLRSVSDLHIQISLDFDLNWEKMEENMYNYGDAVCHPSSSICCQGPSLIYTYHRTGN